MQAPPNYKRHTRTSRGFTFIELLVAVAIIGVLATIVLFSAGTARQRTADKALGQSMAPILLQAEHNYNLAGCYAAASGVCTSPEASPVPTSGTTSCFPASPAAPLATKYRFSIFADPKISMLLNSARSNGGVFSTCKVTAGAASYAISIQSKSYPEQAWCIDSSGNSKVEIAQNINASYQDFSSQGRINATVGVANGIAYCI